MPELTQNFTVPFPRAEVWRFFHNLDRVVTCMPGASLDSVPQDNHLAGRIRVKLGPIVAAFAGKAEVAMNDADYSGVIRGSGLDQKNNSRTRADVSFRLADQSPGTRVDVTVDYTLSGTLAQFSRGAIVQGVAQRLTEEFARNLADAMKAHAAPASTPEEPAPGPATRPAGELRLAGLLYTMLIAWLRRQIGRLTGKAPERREQ